MAHLFLRYSLAVLFKPSIPPSRSLSSVSAQSQPNHAAPNKDSSDTDSDGEGPANLNTRDRDELLMKLRILVQWRSFGSAQKLIKTLISSNHVFSSPTDLFTRFSLSSPHLKRTFSCLVMSACADSNLGIEGVGLLRLLWDEGIFPPLATFNLMLGCLVSDRRFTEATNLFDDAVDLKVPVDVFSYGKAVECAVKMGDLRRGMELLKCMEESGVGFNVLVYNVLISGLCKEKRMSDARRLFDEMLDRNLVPSLVTYNSLIDGYCKVENLEEAFGLRERMKLEKIAPSALTFNSLIHGLCKTERMDEVSSLLGEMKNHGFSPDAYTCSTLLDGYSRCGDVKPMLALFREVTGKQHHLDSPLKQGLLETAEILLEKLMTDGTYVPSVVLYNTILKGYCLANKMKEAISIIDKMENHGLRPTCITFNTLIHKFCESGEMDEADEWMKKMRDKGVDPSVRTYNIMINGYGKKKMFERCFEILQGMENDGMRPNAVTYGSLINCLCQAGMLLEAEVLLGDMMSRGVPPNVHIYNMLIAGYCNSGLTGRAFEFLNEMSKCELVPTLVTYNSLINGLCRKGRFQEAEDLAKEITSKGLNLDVITYNSLIQGYVGLGNVSKSLALYETMKSIGIKPTLRTYRPLISGCCKLGLRVVEKIYGEMTHFNVAPDRDIYNSLVHIYAEHGDVDRANALRDELMNQGIDLVKDHLKVGKV